MRVNSVVTQPIYVTAVRTAVRTQPKIFRVQRLTLLHRACAGTLHDLIDEVLDQLVK